MTAAARTRTLTQIGFLPQAAAALVAQSDAHPDLSDLALDALSHTDGTDMQRAQVFLLYADLLPSRYRGLLSALPVG